MRLMDKRVGARKRRARERSRERVQPTINNERAESVGRECCLRVPFSRSHRPRPALFCFPSPRVSLPFLSPLSPSRLRPSHVRQTPSPSRCTRFVFVIETRPRSRSHPTLLRGTFEAPLGGVTVAPENRTGESCY